MSSLVSESKVIAALNDNLRRFHTGGMVVISRGIAALNRKVWAEVIVAVAEFDRFGPANDPYGEHDCAVVEVGALRVIFKIDYFDSGLEYGSSDPADPAVTTRVLTVMLETEY